VHVVWLKRDLRIQDHAPLALAAEAGDVLVLYVYEPELLHAEEHDPARSVFVEQSLRELDEALRARGAHLTTRVGRMPDVLEALHRVRPLRALYSHRETGNAATFARDRRVRGWCEASGVPWHQRNQTGVVRLLKSRDGWSQRWQRRMNRPLVPTPQRIRPAAGVLAEGVRTLAELDLPPSGKPDAQRGGMAEARRCLDTFLTARGRTYRSDMSTPVAGWESCSRLSPHLAFGTVSMREVHRRTRRRQFELRAMRRDGHPDFDPRWLDSLESFQGRLRWHCHFMQKLEDEPAIEFENMNRAYDGLRSETPDAARLAAWAEGRTGFPMVDACMRALVATGWLNFRMRAMLMSFASYHLWLHWRPTALHLARHFLDYEPGIHFSQAQMQSGTTGVNSVRIYAPDKQAREQDPDGVFIRRWVPELAPIPTAHLAAPHEMGELEQRAHGVRIGVDYPRPIVDARRALRRARLELDRVRGTPHERAAARQVFQKHGSRRRARWRRR
jgi:deoxyribodipyrimidine photo-lyase